LGREVVAGKGFTTKLTKDTKGAIPVGFRIWRARESVSSQYIPILPLIPANAGTQII